MVRFQMKTSNRPQTIAEVRSAADIQSFRSNPEWYEITEDKEKVDTSSKGSPVKATRNKIKAKDSE